MTRSGAPIARCKVSALVQGPMPGTRWSRAAASSGGSPEASSRRRATRTARRIVEERLASTPARCHSQDGIRAQVLGSGITYMWSGMPVGPGAGSPYLRTSSRQAR